MIKSDKGSVTIKGHRFDIEVDLSVVIHYLWKQKFFTKEDLYKIIELSCQGEEDLHKQATEVYPLVELFKRLVFGEERKETYVAEMTDIVEEIKSELAKGEKE